MNGEINAKKCIIIVISITITEDNSENPILKFQYISNNSWLIDSCYKEYNEASLISTEQVNNFFEQYEIQILNHTIKEIC